MPNPNWDVDTYDWGAIAATSNPVIAANYAAQLGHGLGKLLKESQYNTFHLVAHSAGAWLINSIADELKGTGKTVDVTFLDAFVPWKAVGHDNLGANASFAEQYMDTRAIKYEVTAGAVLNNAIWRNGRTGLSLNSVFNIDVTERDPKGSQSLNPEDYISEWHAWPSEFYIGSYATTGGLHWSPELGSVPSHSNPVFARSSTIVLHKAGDTEVGSPADVQVTRRDYSKLDFRALPFELGEPDFANVDSLHIDLTTHSPNWYAALVDVTLPVNLLSFHAEFASSSGGNGLLSVFWDGNLIGTLDERLSGSGGDDISIDMPTTYVSGTFTLAFRLDSYSDSSSQVSISNCFTSYVLESTVPEPSVGVMCVSLVALRSLCRRRAC